MLGMKIHPGLRFWHVADMDQAGNLTDYDPILYFKGRRWSLIPALSNLFQLILFQDGSMTFGRLKKMLKRASADDLAGLENFLGEGFNGKITTKLLRKILGKVSTIVKTATGKKPFTFNADGFIETPARSGFVRPHLREVVLELGAPVYENGGLCGNNCRHCFLGDVAGRFQSQFPGIDMQKCLMTPQRWLEVVEWAERWSVPKIRLSGAPFGQHGWPATIIIARLAAQKAIDLHIHCEVTSFEGWQAEELAQAMAGSLPTIEFSLEGSTADINGLIRRSCADADTVFFNKIIATMRKFAELGFPIAVGTSIHRGNTEDLWPMYVFLKNILGESWIDWCVYQLEKVGRMEENLHLCSTPQQIHEASVVFLKQWRRDGSRELPLLSLPVFGEINPDGALIDTEKIFPDDNIEGLTAFPRDRRMLHISPFGGLKINGMQWMPFKDHYLWAADSDWLDDIFTPSVVWTDDIDKKIAQIWGSHHYQIYKNIPLGWMKNCPSCRIAPWCRGGFGYEAISSKTWDGEITAMLVPDKQICIMAGTDENGKIDCHNLLEIKEILEGDK